MIDAAAQDLSKARVERRELPTFRERAFRALAWSFVVSFASLMIVGILISFSTIPLWDWFECALEFAADVKAGKLSAWFAPCYEHRLVVERVLYWLDVNLFGGHSLFAFLGGLTFAAFAWLLLFCIALPERTTRGDHRFYIGATLALLAFSWIQVPVFVLGGVATVPVFMTMFFPLATFFATAKSKNSPLSFCAAILLGIASAGTGIPGLLALPIATALALALGIGRWRVTLLAVITAVVWAAYFTDFNFPSYESSNFAAIAHPISFLQYFFACVGNVAFWVAFTGIAAVEVLLHGMSAVHPPGKQLNDYPQAVAWSLAFAQVCGAIFTALGLREIVHWYRSDRSPIGGALIAVILFAFGTASVIAAARFDYSLTMAIPARYATMMLFALGAYVLLRGRYLNYYQAGILFFCIAIVLFPRQLTALRRSPSAAEYAEQQRVYQLLKLGKATDADLRILGDPDVIRRVSGRMKEMGMELPR